MTADLYNNVAAVLPVLMLAKITDRYRRRSFRPPANGSFRSHQAFISFALAGEGFALVGAGLVSFQRATATWSLICTTGVSLMVVLCGIMFGVEILRAE